MIHKVWLIGPLCLLGLAVFLTGCGKRVSPGKPMSEEEQLVRQFAELKNAKSAKANDLLGPSAEVSKDAIPADEAQRLDADVFLRRDYQVKEVRPTDATAAGSSAFVLVIEGNLMSEPMTVQTAEGKTETGTRQIYNPDITVEVRGGKIHGVKAGLHEEPNQRPLTPREQERLKKLLLGEQ